MKKIGKLFLPLLALFAFHFMIGYLLKKLIFVKENGDVERLLVSEDLTNLIVLLSMIIVPVIIFILGFIMDAKFYSNNNISRILRPIILMLFPVAVIILFFSNTYFATFFLLPPFIWAIDYADGWIGFLFCLTSIISPLIYILGLFCYKKIKRQND